MLMMQGCRLRRVRLRGDEENCGGVGGAAPVERDGRNVRCRVVWECAMCDQEHVLLAFHIAAALPVSC